MAVGTHLGFGPPARHGEDDQKRDDADARLGGTEDAEDSEQDSAQQPRIDE